MTEFALAMVAAGAVVAVLVYDVRELLGGGVGGCRVVDVILPL